MAFLYHDEWVEIYWKWLEFMTWIDFRLALILRTDPRGNELLNDCYNNQRLSSFSISASSQLDTTTLHSCITKAVGKFSINRFFFNSRNF